MKLKEAEVLIDKIKWRVFVLALLVLMLDVYWWRP